MRTIAAFAIVMFLLGLFFGLPYQKASRRRRALMEEEKNNPDKKKNGPTPLDKPASS